MFVTALDALRTEFAELLPIALLFAAVAAVTKRDALLAGLKRARPEIATNLALLIVNTVVLVPLVAVPVVAATELIPRSGALVAFWESMPAALAVLAAILLIDLVAYWRHRFEHARALWPIHATHHADEAMNWLSLRRKHPLGEALSIIFDGLLVIAIGLPFWAIMAAFVLRSWWGYFVHADVPWTLGPVGRVLISPAAHRLHHIRDERLMGYNFGNTVTLWDKLFGTYRDPAPYLNCETGIAEGTRDLLGELARPFEARYRRAPDAEVAEQPAS
ncbi:sterol desaturase family protein [Porphyrobacter sp. TH134]|uniref:sterol desaturase family protein n=1 Tax=Porphyrobacter sp. TH134 TaxID=2067450 RepID=UPI000C7A4C63|nr:sterol desaturase family protein [Porphyrobacter sp. TH134]PLK24880.1 sterol desaturase family protein [Porphyrobacter sp. TH134]